MQIPAFKLERYFAQYEFNVKYVLCASDCESFSIQDLLDFEPNAADLFHQHWLGYTESQGRPSLQREISNLYENIEPQQVLVHTGAEEKALKRKGMAPSTGKVVLLENKDTVSAAS